jgi:hypothetical protein
MCVMRFDVSFEALDGSVSKATTYANHCEITVHLVNQLIGSMYNRNTPITSSNKSRGSIHESVHKVHHQNNDMTRRRRC